MTASTSAPDAVAAFVAAELERDLAMLRDAESGARPAFRTWTAAAHVVVVGRSVEVEREVDRTFCLAHGIPIVTRPSGGRSVLIGPGTLQYTFAASYDLAPELGSIAGTKRLCNSMLLRALTREHPLLEDPSGDLVAGARKVGGLALRRSRKAVMLHGTLLVDADLAVIESALRHPQREPDYRNGRCHRDFLDNLGRLDVAGLERTVRGLLAALARRREPDELLLSPLPTRD